MNAVGYVVLGVGAGSGAICSTTSALDARMGAATWPALTQHGASSAEFVGTDGLGVCPYLEHSAPAHAPGESA